MFLRRSLGKKYCLFSSVNKPKYYDVVCSGAGIVGQSFALALSNHQYFQECSENKILLLDLQEPKPIQDFMISDVENINMDTVIPSQRTYAISHTSYNYLKALGVIDNIEPKRMKPYYFMQVWETDGDSYIQFKEDDASSMGFTIENDHLSAGLYSKILEQQQNKEISSIDTRFKDTIKEINRLENEGMLE